MRQGAGRRAEPAQAEFWATRWRRLLAPPADAELRAERLGRDLERWRELQADIAFSERQLEALLGKTQGQILTTLPGVAVNRAAAFSAFTLPVERWPSPEHPYSATGLAAACLRVRDLEVSGPNQPSGAARASRRADGDRLGPLAAEPGFRRPRLRAEGARLPPDPGSGRARAQRLPALLAHLENPGAVRRTALR